VEEVPVPQDLPVLAKEVAQAEGLRLSFFSPQIMMHYYSFL
jgi:hypothetical protein